MEQPSLSYPCFSRPSGANSNHADLLEAYKDHLLQERGVLQPNPQLKVVASFLTLLEASHCKLNEIRALHIQTFITEQGHYYQRKTIASIASYLRNFFAVSILQPARCPGTVRVRPSSPYFSGRTRTSLS